VIPCKDADLIDHLTSPFPRIGFSKEDWGEGENIALIDNLDLFLFEYVRDSHYRGHYFLISRGKEALRLSQEALKFMFTKARVIEGWTPLENKAAVWMSRRLGFKDHGQLETIAGPMRLFIMTRDEYEQSIRGV